MMTVYTNKYSATSLKSWMDRINTLGYPVFAEGGASWERTVLVIMGILLVEVWLTTLYFRESED